MRSTWLGRLAASGFHQTVRAGALTVILLALTGTVQAGFSNAPEINPGSLGSAIALLSGGLLLLRDRFRAS